MVPPSPYCPILLYPTLSPSSLIPQPRAKSNPFSEDASINSIMTNFVLSALAIPCCPTLPHPPALSPPPTLSSSIAGHPSTAHPKLSYKLNSSLAATASNTSAQNSTPQPPPTVSCAPSPPLKPSLTSSFIAQLSTLLVPHLLIPGLTPLTPPPWLSLITSTRSGFLPPTPLLYGPSLIPLRPPLSTSTNLIHTYSPI